MDKSEFESKREDKEMEENLFMKLGLEEADTEGDKEIKSVILVS